MNIVKTFEKEEIANLVEMSSDTPHRLVNNGDSRLRLLNVKAPRPTKPTHIVAER